VANQCAAAKEPRSQRGKDAEESDRTFFKLLL